jgi:hypothetical protein
MLKRSSKKPKRGLNQIAASVVSQSTGQSGPDKTPEKNPAAVALGRLGGLKGGKARAEKLSKKRRKEIAQVAAAVRWTRNLPELD